MTNEIIANLEGEWAEDLTPLIRQSLLGSGRTVVVLDDDPTGTQTVYDVPVLTVLDVESLKQEFLSETPLVFLLTNSRSMTAAESESFHRALIKTLKLAASETDRQVEVISRSDSTLRGHFPLETDVIAQGWPEQSDLVLLMPFFQEGQRLTIDGQHFVGEGENLIPAHETPFAQDPVFGFQHSYMPDYIEEKTKGRVLAGDVIKIPIEVIRREGQHGVRKILEESPAGSFCIADGVSDSDARVVAFAVGECNRNVLARVAASYVRARSGLPDRPLLSKNELQQGSHPTNGGLIVVGSHVPKTTAQLKELLNRREGSKLIGIELSVQELFGKLVETVEALTRQVDVALNAGKDVVLFTSRELVKGQDDADNLRISKLVSSALVEIVSKIQAVPRFLVAKGGITSSDIATEALGVQRAIVAGSILPGVPVWKLGQETRFPGMHFVIFPGNVGGNEALAEAIEKL